MSKRALKKSKRRSNAVVPALGITGLSLALASGAAASTSEATTKLPSTSQPHELFLGEEEIFDVSLATFYVSDKETAGTLPPGVQVAGACSGSAGCGCGCCGGAAEMFYRSGMLGTDADPPRQKPVHKYTHARKRTHVPKNL